MQRVFPTGVVLVAVLAVGGCSATKPIASSSPPAAQSDPRSATAASAPKTQTPVVPAPKNAAAATAASESSPAKTSTPPKTAASVSTPAKTTTPPPKAPPKSTPKATASSAKSPEKPADKPLADKPAAAVANAAPAAPVQTLDLRSLEQRLRDTRAIGIMTKLSLKNQVDDLLDEFRGFYAGKVKTELTALRQRYDLLLMKVLSLLQDSDAALASAIASSRESIWGILRDPKKLAEI